MRCRRVPRFAAIKQSIRQLTIVEGCVQDSSAAPCRDLVTLSSNRRSTTAGSSVALWRMLLCSRARVNVGFRLATVLSYGAASPLCLN